MEALLANARQNKQKRIEQKRAKRKSAQKKNDQGTNQTGRPSFRAIITIPKAPVHECWITSSIYEEGMGHVVVSRMLTNGNIAFGGFLLDIYCLGVKDCFLSIKPKFEYDGFRAKYESMYKLENIHQTCAFKLVDGAVDYARSLGFKPHKDFKNNKLIFGDLDPSLCPTTYEYGKDGKPFYISGPDDSQARQQSIINQLRRVYKDDEFDFMVGDLPLDVVDEIDGKDLMFSEYSITGEPISDEYSDRVPEAAKGKEEEMRDMLFDSPTQAIPILKDLIEKYPGAVKFRNFLSNAYQLIGDDKNSRRVAFELYREEPDYLFAKLNYAKFCLQDKDLEAIPEIFNGKYDLKGIYPDRNEFHISEAIGFFSVMARYFIQTGDIERAQVYGDMLEHIDPDHPATIAVRKALKFKNGFMSSMVRKILAMKK